MAYYVCSGAKLKCSMGSQGSRLSYYEDMILSEAKAKDVKVPVSNAVEPCEDVKTLTVKDFAELLERIERKKGYESARYYVTHHVDYWKLTNLARRYIDETNEAKKEDEKDNDPNLMLSRFMLLYARARKHGYASRRF